MLPITESQPNVLRSARGSLVLLWVGLLLAAVFLIDHPVFLAVVLVVTLAAGVKAGLSRLLIRLLCFALPLAFLSAAINAFAVRDGLTVVVRLGVFPVLGRLDLTAEAFAAGGMLALRVLCVTVICALFTFAADPDTLLFALRRVSGRVAITASLALRIVPLLLADAKRFQIAQRSRVHSPHQRIAVFRAVLTNALDRSMSLATTLELRGYGLDTGKTRGGQTRLQPFSRHDRNLLISSGVLLLSVACILVFKLLSFRFYPTIQGVLTGFGVALLVVICAAVLVPFFVKRGLR